MAQLFSSLKNVMTSKLSGYNFVIVADGDQGHFGMCPGKAPVRHVVSTDHSTLRNDTVMVFRGTTRKCLWDWMSNDIANPVCLRYLRLERKISTDT